MPSHSRIDWGSWWRAPAGVALFALSVLGVIHGVRTERAQLLYFAAKYGSASGNPKAVLSYCASASALYRYNYRACVLAAETALYSAPDRESEKERNERLAAAKSWCNRGLALNWYKRELRRMMADLIWEDSPARAIEYWKAYVDFDFWFPYNHAALAEMYARAGDFANAEKELSWTRGSDYYQSTLDALARERAAPKTPAASSP